jgi:L-ascorbate metabolism protein UlaG (beta-lactamase superfamily)
MSVSIRWLGTAGIELEHRGNVILLDPYLSRLGKKDIFFRPLLPRKDVISWYINRIRGNVRAIVVGHTHFDHALDIPEIVHGLNCSILGSPSLDKLLSLSGLPGRVTACNSKEQVNLGEDMSVFMIPSAHGLIFSRLLLLEGDIDPGLTLPLRTRQYRLGAMSAPKVTMGGLTLLHVGSAGFIEKELEGHSCDILFLCVAGWKNWPLYPQRVMEILQPSCVIPIHYDDFSIPLMPGWKCPVMRSADLDGFCKRVKMSRPGIEVRLIEPFSATSF